MLCCSAGKKGDAEEAKAVPVTANGSSAAAAGKGADAAGPGPQGQLVEVKFRAPKAGKYDLTLFCVSGACRCPFQVSGAEGRQM